MNLPKPQLIGILNITPDSFSDGGHYMDANAALYAIEHLITDGADIIDIGAESTRPGATPLSHAEEWERLAPILKQAIDFSVPVSVDTRHVETARKALALGAAWINDVSGFADESMIETVKNTSCKLVVMHSLSVPADKNITIPASADIIKTLLDFANTRAQMMQKAGIERERLIFDPGIGFGKTPAQSQEIIDRIEELKACGLPLFVGHSRKSFFQFPAASTLEQKDKATLAISKQLAASGVEYLRVHNVKLHADHFRHCEKASPTKQSRSGLPRFARDDGGL